MKKIKVMNLIWTMGDGGAQQIVLNYLRAFHNDPDIDFRLYVYTGPTNSKYDREIREKNYNVVYLNYPKTRIQIPYVRRFFQPAVSQKHWEAAIREFQPDIVHVHVSDLLAETMPGILKANVPVRFDTLHSNPYRYKGKMRRIISDAFQNRNVTPICLTEEQVHMARDWYGIQSYELVRNGLDIAGIRQAACSRQEARAHFGLDPDAFVVIGVGRLDPIKNFSLLIRSFAQVLKIRPDAKLVFAGEGAEKNKLLRLAEELHIAEHVTFLGNITNVSRLYSAADVLGLTSITEALPLVVLEAQFCGLRCIVSDGVPSESILLESSRKMPAGASPEAWAEALLDTEFHGSDVLPMELYDVHHTNRQIREIYLNYYRQAMDRENSPRA